MNTKLNNTSLLVMQQLSQKHVKTLSFLSSGSEQQNENKNVEQ